MSEAAPPSAVTTAAAVQSATAPSGSNAGAASEAAAAGASSTSGRRAPPPFCRSRTDSLIRYTPTTQAEAPGATFYVDKKGDLDYVVLLKVSNLWIGGPCVHTYVCVKTRKLDWCRSDVICMSSE